MQQHGEHLDHAQTQRCKRRQAGLDTQENRQKHAYGAGKLGGTQTGLRERTDKVIDRIRQLQVTDAAFQKKHPSLTTYLNQVTKKERQLHKVVMVIDKSIVKYLGDQKYYNGFVSEKETGNSIEMTFLTSSPEGFARWYMMFGDEGAAIISPPAIKKRVKEIANAILKKLK